MFIPDVINTLLMGLIFMVVIVTVVRPFVLSIVGDAMSNNDMHKAAMVEVEREMLRKAELFEAQRADKIRYQMLLLEKNLWQWSSPSQWPKFNPKWWKCLPNPKWWWKKLRLRWLLKKRPQKQAPNPLRMKKPWPRARLKFAKASLWLKSKTEFAKNNKRPRSQPFHLSC